MPVVQRDVPASRYSQQPITEADISSLGDSPTRQQTARLKQADVLAILKQGKRLSRPGFDLRFLFAPADQQQDAAKMAIAVPKRLLKSAVARNRIKRQVREVFRMHVASTAPLNILVTLKVKNDGKRADARLLLRADLATLFDDVVRRANTRAPAAQNA